jgi:MFS family permease
MQVNNDIDLNQLNQNFQINTIDISKIEQYYKFEWFCFKPKLKYKIFNWKFTFVFLCLTCFFENLVTSGVATVILSTLEREFFWSSTQSGLFLSLFELAAFFASPIFGFLGTRFNKMKILSSSCFIVTLGSFVIGLTIFLKKPDFDTTSLRIEYNNLLCLPNNTNITKCILNENHFIGSNLQLLIYLGHFVIGFGSVALYTIAVAYIEEITTKEQSSYCQAIYYGLGIFYIKIIITYLFKINFKTLGAGGSGVGILLTGQFLNLNARFYTNTYTLQNLLTPKSNLWIGAW